MNSNDIKHENIPPGLISAFTFGNFVIGCGVVAVSGMMTALAKGIGESVASIGQLVAISAVVMALGAPLVAAFTSRIDRRVLLVTSMFIYAFGNLACALAPNYTTLTVARAFAVIAPAIFTPQAAATLGSLLPPEKRSGAVTRIFLGWSLASVIGMPLGNVIAEVAGWRYAFGTLALLSFISVFWLAKTMHKGWKVAPLSLESWKQTARHPQIRLILLVTMLSLAGQFASWSFVNPLLNFWLGSSVIWVTALMVLFGVFGFLGSTWITTQITRLAPHRAVQITLYSMIFGVLLWCVLPWLTGLPILLLGALCAGQILWGFGCFSCNSGQQARLVSASPQLASIGVALNTSSLYAGQALGSWAGAAVLAGHAPTANGLPSLQALQWLPVISLLGLVSAAFVSTIAARKLT